MDTHPFALTARSLALASALVHGLFALCLATSAAGAEKNPKGLKSTQTGLASFYGRDFDGKKTASGERFDSDELTAAHPSYPLGTRVRVTNLEKNTSVVVRITDRGPTAPNRREGVIIDVSKAAATQLQMRKDGRVRVRVHVLEWGEDGKEPAAAKTSAGSG